MAPEVAFEVFELEAVKPAAHGAAGTKREGRGRNASSGDRRRALARRPGAAWAGGPPGAVRHYVARGAALTPQGLGRLPWPRCVARACGEGRRPPTIVECSAVSLATFERLTQPTNVPGRGSARAPRGTAAPPARCNSLPPALPGGRARRRPVRACRPHRQQRPAPPPQRRPRRLLREPQARRRRPRGEERHGRVDGRVMEREEGVRRPDAEQRVGRAQGRLADRHRPVVGAEAPGHPREAGDPRHGAGRHPGDDEHARRPGRVPALKEMPRAQRRQLAQHAVAQAPPPDGSSPRSPGRAGTAVRGAKHHHAACLPLPVHQLERAPEDQGPRAVRNEVYGVPGRRVVPLVVPQKISCGFRGGVQAARGRARRRTRREAATQQTWVGVPFQTRRTASSGGPRPSGATHQSDASLASIACTWNSPRCSSALCMRDICQGYVTAPAARRASQTQRMGGRTPQNTLPRAASRHRIPRGRGGTLCFPRHKRMAWWASFLTWDADHRRSCGGSGRGLASLGKQVAERHRRHDPRRRRQTGAFQGATAVVGPAGRRCAGHRRPSCRCGRRASARAPRHARPLRKRSTPTTRDRGCEEAAGRVDPGGSVGAIPARQRRTRQRSPRGHYAASR